MTLERLEKDFQEQSKIVNELAQNEIRRQDRERSQAEIELLKERHLDERFDRIEAKVAAVYNLGKWLLASAGSTLVLAVVTFAIKGGFFSG